MMMMGFLDFHPVHYLYPAEVRTFVVEAGKAKNWKTRCQKAVPGLYVLYPKSNECGDRTHDHTINSRAL